MIVGGKLIACKNTEKKTIVLYPRGKPFLTTLPGTVTATPGKQIITTSANTTEAIRRGDAICIHQNNASDYGSWYRVSSGTDSANEAQRAKAPLSVTSDKEMSKRNVYSEEFDAKHLPLDGDYDGDVAVVNGIALKHGCSNDIRTSWANTGNEIKQFVGREQALTAELLRHKLITRSNDDNTRRIVGGKAKMISAGKKERKKRAISASSSSNHNVHLVGTALEFLAN
jgi:hypothetical protein